MSIIDLIQSQVGNGTITSIKMQQFRDGVAEWAAFANLHFIEFTGTPPANYITVQENSTGFEGGFSSSVGMAGGEQFVQFGPNSWNRGTVCHEVGHAIGSGTNNSGPIAIPTSLSTLPISIPGSSLTSPLSQAAGPSARAYDFYSVMHYRRNDLSNNGHGHDQHAAGLTRNTSI